MITQQRLRDLFSYDVETGLFVCNTTRGNRKKGELCCTTNKGVYAFLMVDYVTILYHRAIWIWHYGEITHDDEIDHIDRDKRNNKIENLRKVKRNENGQNIPISSRNKSGYRGVSWNSEMKKWCVQVHHKQQRYYIGYFDNVHLAGEIAKQKRNEIFTHHKGE